MWTASSVLKAVGLFVAQLLSSITDWFQTKAAWADLRVLQETELRTTGGVHERYKAKALWEKTGAVVMVVRRPGSLLCREEAAELSSLQPQLQDMSVPLLAVVKQNIGKELDTFKKYFSGKVYVDQQEFLRPCPAVDVPLSVSAYWGVEEPLAGLQKRVQGNLRGEGFVLGGVFVIGPGDQGILLEHREKEFGDKVNMLAVLTTVRKMQKNIE